MKTLSCDCAVTFSASSFNETSRLLAGDESNIGISFVVPAEALLKVLNSDKAKQRRDDELKQKAFVEGIGALYSAQDAFQSKIVKFIEDYEAECARLKPAE